MIDLATAQAILCGESAPVGTERISLDRALGRVLARSVKADRDFPPTDRSAMDGFAVRTADAGTHPSLLRVIGEVRAGQSTGNLVVGPGQAARIMTGAIVPAGADAVVMVEKTRECESDGTVRIDDTPAAGQHIRRRGEDLKGGATVLEPGVRIRSAEIGALASVGAADVEVFRSPRVSVLSTGDEIVEPNRRPEPHQIRNSNSRVLLAQLAELGLDGRYLGIAGDESGELDRLLSEGLRGDVLLVTGGVSAGKYDLVGPSLVRAGMRQLFHKVSIKPGKPVLAGRREGCLVVGCPGNPISTFVVFAVLIAPALRKMVGRTRWENRLLTARLDEPLQVRPGRETYHLARLISGDQGITAHRISTTGSGDVLAPSRANGFIVTEAAGADLAAGADVRVLTMADGDL